jgi:hypothetical protein
LSSGVDRGLKVNQIFPLLANQSRLSSQFRQAGRSCLSRIAQRATRNPAEAARTVGSTSEPGGSEGPPAGGGGRNNNGLGNGGEGRAKVTKAPAKRATQARTRRTSLACPGQPSSPLMALAISVRVLSMP